ncbi:cyclin-dependent protein kinase [Gregarina niphandrodes]|uniref:Cyclin-dependent kinase 2 homolog n=1 Tax=Gregarina niphandrodes TaxID=110365 RepID=A0A023B1Y7_GRENI|nr:cyclin-dependent protein kinase [Gregarina niphandrodes]EZG47084.1 cyclin-dependent protein kinase [Gregarina niphandrodes]|eukprot:XP_011132210.1 cyclin-dependent protein kinase [Gregarina niphandrodes]
MIKQKNTEDTRNLSELRQPTWFYGVSKQVYQEIMIMKELVHPNLIGVTDVYFGKNSINLVMPLMRTDLRAMLDKRTLTESQMKSVMQQLLRGIYALHSNWFLHRDLTPGNVFLTQDGLIKVADYGLATTYGGPKRVPLLDTVVTLWYRSPELLFNADLYQDKVDIWSCGCIMGEVLRGGKVLFNGQDEIDQLKKIFCVTGTPSAFDTKNNTDDKPLWPEARALLKFEAFTFKQPTHWSEIIPTASPLAIDLLGKMLLLDPNKRPSAKEALEHPWFTTPPLPVHHKKLPVID